MPFHYWAFICPAAYLLQLEAAIHSVDVQLDNGFSFGGVSWRRYGFSSIGKTLIQAMLSRSVSSENSLVAVVVDWPSGVRSWVHFRRIRSEFAAFAVKKRIGRRRSLFMPSV